MLSPDVLDPAGALGLGVLLTLLAVWLWRPRKQHRGEFVSLDCRDLNHSACDDCDGCACHGDWSPRHDDDCRYPARPCVCSVFPDGGQ